jgi:putative transcriptional regulator
MLAAPASSCGECNPSCPCGKLATHCRGAVSEKSKFLKGQLLLDAGDLAGSFFARTVVLICQHDAEGAFGLVINRTTDKKFSEVISTELPESLKDEPLFLGGPVQPTAMSFLHGEAYLPEANVISGLNLGHSLDELVELGGGYSPTRKLKTFAGYAGWAPGQLESEMKRKAWITHPATLDLVFDPEPEKLWKKILRTKGWRYEILAQMPEDPSMN